MNQSKLKKKQNIKQQNNGICLPHNASVLSSSVVDRGYELESGQSKDYNINMCCFSARHAALRSKISEW
jgi:predicted class III extradiol MEMO1 family dioxygenase